MATNPKFKITEKGTELPIRDIQGKPYLDVAYRLVWFREVYPHGKILTDIVSVSETEAVVRATVSIPDTTAGIYLELSTAHKRKEKGRLPHIETAETGAVGRALAFAGFGTQFEPELDEVEDMSDLSDSPVVVPGKALVAAKAAAVSSDPWKDLERLSDDMVAKKKLSAQAFMEMLRSQFGVPNLYKLTEAQVAVVMNKLNVLK